MPVDKTDFSTIIHLYIEALNLDKDLLNRLDKNLSGGDHGDKIYSAFSKIFEIYPDFEKENLSQQFFILSRIANDEMNGSMSSIYGYTFYNISLDLEDVDNIDRKIFSDILDRSCSYIAKIGSCDIGDKTILDAVYASSQSIKKSMDFPVTRLLNQLVADTKTACDRTASMLAKKCNSKYNQTFSIGTIDPGAYSFYLLMETIYKYHVKRDRRR